MLFGLPYLGREKRLPVPETNDLYFKNYLQVIMLFFADLRRKGLLPQTSALDIYIHQVKLGRVLIKSWKNDTLTLTWEGSFQIHLTIETAVHTAERSWSHATQIKGPVESPPRDWTVMLRNNPLKLTLKR